MKKSKKPKCPPDCVKQSDRQALHYLDGGAGGEILCGHAVTREPFQGKPYTMDHGAVTCWDCVQALVARGVTVRRHAPPGIS